MGWNNCKNARTCGHSICFEKACKKYDPIERTQQTNGDRIRAMSDEELAEFLHKKSWLCESYHLCNECPMYHEEKGCLSTDEWLKQPAEGE